MTWKPQLENWNKKLNVNTSQMWKENLKIIGDPQTPVVTQVQSRAVGDKDVKPKNQNMTCGKAWLIYQKW